MEIVERLSSPGWELLNDSEAREVVHMVEGLVPRARFIRFEKGARRVAVFDVGGREMVLIPGGAVTLGFEPDGLPDLTNEAWAASQWGQGHAAQQGLGGPDVGRRAPDELLGYLQANTTPKRDVVLRPFLIERAFNAQKPMSQMGGDDVDFEDPHLEMALAVQAEGFRLPTSDEWEYAASGGRRTFFRWDGPWPVATDVWSGGDFKAHHDANDFGIRFAKSPYDCEIISDPEELRGGDGGTLVCGDAGPVAWVTFAPSFRTRLKVTDARDIWFEQAYPRRVLSIFKMPEDREIQRYV